MHLYNITIQKPNAILLAVYGSFSESGANEIIVSRGKILEIFRVLDTGKLISLHSTEVYGIIRSMKTFRHYAGSQDYIIIGSDSGRIVILQYKPIQNIFEKVQQETFGKTGCRRIVPGQYIAIDYNGRAVMLAALEKQKLAFHLNRDLSTKKLTISSPLEGHKSHTIVFDLIAIHTGLNNPTFASLEIDYSEADEDPTGESAKLTPMTVSYYELDLGLNNIVRKWAEQAPKTSNKLIPVPGGTLGPGGVIVCSEGCLTYMNDGMSVITTKLPIRSQQVDSKPLIVAYAALELRETFFCLVQTEFGDLFKIDISQTDKTTVDITASYFDTLPVAINLCLTKNGFLFCCNESGNHFVYTFSGYGDKEITSNSLTTETPTFSPRLPNNLVLVDEIPSINPCTKVIAADLLNEDAPQLYTLCGKGPRSTLRVLKHGLSVTEVASAPIPGIPSNCWSVKQSNSDLYESFIVISFQDRTLIMKLGESLEEVKESEFITDKKTLGIQLLSTDQIVQIYQHGIRVISDQCTEWTVPEKKIIDCAASNERQIVISVGNSEIYYFEVSESGMLEEASQPLYIGVPVSCLDLGQIPMQRSKSSFLAVGCFDKSVKIYSLREQSMFQPLSVKMCEANPFSLCISLMVPTENVEVLFLNIGLENGIYERIEINQQTGKLVDPRYKGIGIYPVKIYPLKIEDQNVVMALSNKPWLSYCINSYRLNIISYDHLDCVASFKTEQCPDGIVGFTEDQLKIFRFNRLEEEYHQTLLNLTFTPRDLCIRTETRSMVLVETDHNSFNFQQVQLLDPTLNEPLDAEIYGTGSTRLSLIGIPRPNVVEESNEKLGMKVTSSKWGSCIRLVDPVSLTTLDIHGFENNEAAFKANFVEFHDRGETLLVVGCARNLQLFPRVVESGVLYTFRIISNTKFQLLHTTEVEQVPMALHPFQGRLLVGMGKILRLYDMGKRRLLRKCENRTFPHSIVSIDSLGDRIYVGDQQDSFSFVKYKKTQNQLVIFADDPVQHHITGGCVMDYFSVCGVDKFGSIFGCRVDRKISDDIVNPTGNRVLWETGYLNASANKLESIFHFYTGEALTSVQMTRMSPTGSDFLLYSSIFGSLSGLVPITNKHDYGLLQHLEMFLRQHDPSLVGREQIHFRSLFAPVKDVIDGDLCEQFNSLRPEVQSEIASKLDRTVGEIIKKLEEMRNKII